MEQCYNPTNLIIRDKNMLVQKGLHCELLSIHANSNGYP